VTHFVHPQGLCETDQVGERTRVWAFAHVLKGAVIGADCNICDHVFIEEQVVLGDRVTVKCGVQLWNGVIAEDDVFIGPNATFSNDRFPRSRHYQASFPTTLIQKGASIGAGAVILPGITIGQNAMVGAGSVVTSNVQPNAVVTGNPARVTGYMDMTRPPDLAATDIAAIDDAAAPVVQLAVTGVTLHRLRLIEDMRGNLAVGEFTRDIPFVPQRYFTIFDVPSYRVRGEHALRSCDQFLVCVRGHCTVMFDDGATRQEQRLDSPDLGLFIPAMTWSTLYKFSPDAILTVFASRFYDADDYIRDYQDYLTAIGPA